MRRWSAALALLWSKIVTPREAYASIDWQVLLMLYGLLGLGMAMQNTGTAEVAGREHGDLAEGFVAPDMLPLVMLWLVFLLTLLLTEVLSNNATAVMMIPIVVTLAGEPRREPLAVHHGRDGGRLHRLRAADGLSDAHDGLWSRRLSDSPTSCAWASR